MQCELSCETWSAPSVSVERLGPGPIGATCGMCAHGPGSGQGTVLWFCPISYSIVAAQDRACSAFVARVPVTA